MVPTPQLLVMPTPAVPSFFLKTFPDPLEMIEQIIRFFIKNEVVLDGCNQNLF